jgi:hypothetical protein
VGPLSDLVAEAFAANVAVVGHDPSVDPPSVDIRKLFSLSPTKNPNKQEHFSLANLSILWPVL